LCRYIFEGTAVEMDKAQRRTKGSFGNTMIPTFVAVVVDESRQELLCSKIEHYAFEQS